MVPQYLLIFPVPSQQVSRKHLEHSSREHNSFRYHSPIGRDLFRRSSQKPSRIHDTVPAVRTTMRRGFGKKDKTIIIIRKQFQKFLQHSRQHETLRNQLITDLPCLMGLRIWEISHLYWQGVNTSEGRLTIINSKSKYEYPLPLPYSLAEKLEAYRRGRQKGFVIRRLHGAAYSETKKKQPLTNCAIWETWRRIAKRAGIEDWEKFNPRLGRHYFTAMAAYHPNSEKRLSLETIRRILRHKDLNTTQLYLARLVVFEDIQRDYSRLHTIPQIQDRKNLSCQNMEYGQVELREECLTCPAVQVCKYKEQYSRDEAADGCRFRKKMLEAWGK